MLKKDEVSNPKSCLNKAADDEPVFVLRAKDPIAAEVVRDWAERAFGKHEDDKIDDANQLATQMERWRRVNVDKEILTGFTEPREDDEMPLLECES
jgi:hypothetical protein